MAILQVETYGFLASGYLPIQYGGYTAVLACFPNQTGVTINISGTKQYLIPFWASGGAIVSGAPQQCSTATPYAGYTLTVLDDSRMLYTTQTGGKTWGTVFKLNSNGTFSSGTTVQFPWTVMAGYNGYQTPRAELRLIRTFSGAITKFVYGGSDWLHGTTAPIPTMQVGNVSGMTILNVTTQSKMFSDASRWDYVYDTELVKIDDYHVGVHMVGDDRFRFARINDDDSITLLGTDHAEFTNPVGGYGVQIVQLNAVSGIAITHREANGTNDRLRLRPFKWINGQVQWIPGASGLTHLDNDLVIYPPGGTTEWMYGGNFHLRNGVRCDDNTIGLCHENNYNGQAVYARFDGQRVNPICSGWFTPLPTGGLNCRPYSLCVAPLAGSGMFAAYQRWGTDSAGVCAVVRPSGAGPSIGVSGDIFYCSGIFSNWVEALDDNRVILMYHDKVGSGIKAMIATVSDYSVSFSAPTLIGTSNADSAQGAVGRMGLGRLDDTHFVAIYPGTSSARGASIRLIEVSGNSLNTPDSEIALSSSNFCKGRAIGVASGMALICGQDYPSVANRPTEFFNLAVYESGHLSLVYGGSGVMMSPSGPNIGYGGGAPHDGDSIQWDANTILYALCDSTWTNSNYIAPAQVRPLRLSGRTLAPSGQWQNIQEYSWQGGPLGMVALSPSSILSMTVGADNAMHTYGAIRRILVDPENDVFIPSGGPFDAGDYSQLTGGSNIFGFLGATLKISDHSVLFTAGRNVPGARGVLVTIGSPGPSSTAVMSPLTLTNTKALATSPAFSMATDNVVAVATPESGPYQYFLGFLSQTSGAVFIESGVLPMTCWAVGHASGNVPDYIHGHDVVSGTVNLALHGHVVASGMCPMATHGYLPTSGKTDLFVHGYECWIDPEDQIGAFIHGRDLATGIIPFCVWNAAGSGNGIDLTYDPLIRDSKGVAQIIANLKSPPPTTVTIELWYLGPQGVSGLALSSSGCTPVGDTGYWTWPLANLPVCPGTRPQFHYRMTGSDGGEYMGQFRVARPRGV